MLVSLPSQPGDSLANSEDALSALVTGIDCPRVQYNHQTLCTVTPLQVPGAFPSLYLASLVYLYQLAGGSA